MADDDEIERRRLLARQRRAEMLRYRRRQTQRRRSLNRLQEEQKRKNVRGKKAARGRRGLAPAGRRSMTPRRRPGSPMVHKSGAKAKLDMKGPLGDAVRRKEHHRQLAKERAAQKRRMQPKGKRPLRNNVRPRPVFGKAATRPTHAKPAYTKAARPAGKVSGKPSAAQAAKRAANKQKISVKKSRSASSPNKSGTSKSRPPSTKKVSGKPSAMQSYQRAARRSPQPSQTRKPRRGPSR